MSLTASRLQDIEQMAGMHHCPVCRYDLRGSAGLRRCSECGLEFGDEAICFTPDKSVKRLSFLVLGLLFTVFVAHIRKLVVRGFSFEGPFEVAATFAIPSLIAGLALYYVYYFRRPEFLLLDKEHIQFQTHYGARWKYAWSEVQSVAWHRLMGRVTLHLKNGETVTIHNRYWADAYKMQEVAAMVEQRWRRAAAGGRKEAAS